MVFNYTLLLLFSGIFFFILDIKTTCLFKIHVHHILDHKDCKIWVYKHNTNSNKKVVFKYSFISIPHLVFCSLIWILVKMIACSFFFFIIYRIYTCTHILYKGIGWNILDKLFAFGFSIWFVRHLLCLSSSLFCQMQTYSSDFVKKKPSELLF